MLREAVEIIRELWSGDIVTYRGEHFDVESAKLWDTPDETPPIGIACSGPESCRLAGELADVMVAVEPKPELGEMFDATGGAGKPRVGQLAVCYDEDEGAAVKRAHEQFRWFGLGWPVNAELPHPSAFDSASQSVREEDVAQQMPCGPDVSRYLEALRGFEEAGFTEVALVQVGGEHQDQFFDWAEKELLPALRS
jgi:G6PDH family F420-dependent oxidoreductase